MKTLILAMVLISPLSSFGATDCALQTCVYIRAGASGTGADWTNALGSLPATLTRGSVYFVADGTYPNYTFDDPVSGTTNIVVRKAILADHGTNTGWQDIYGDGQAVFGDISITTSNYIIDGQVRNESDWFESAAYGFAIGKPTSQRQIIIQNYGRAPDNITIKYVYIPGWSAPLPNTTLRIQAIDVDDYDGGTISTGLVFHRMYVTGACNVWFLRTTDGAIVEYSASKGVMSNSANHGEIVNLYYSGNNATVRFNKFKDVFTDNGSGGGTAVVAITYADGLKFYGNVVVNFKVGDGSIGYDGAYSSHNRIYNNTFVNSVGYNSGMVWGSGTDNVVMNNLFINCPTINIAGTHNYNSFSDGNARGESNAQINVSTSIFRNYSAGDFTLASPTAVGSVLTSPYDTDLSGISRGTDGVFDRGAYEFRSGAQPMPLSAPKSLRLVNIN